MAEQKSTCRCGCGAQLTQRQQQRHLRAKLQPRAKATGTERRNKHSHKSSIKKPKKVPCDRHPSQSPPQAGPSMDIDRRGIPGPSTEMDVDIQPALSQNHAGPPLSSIRDVNGDASLDATNHTRAQIGSRSRFAATVEDYDSESESDDSDDGLESGNSELEEEEELDEEGLTFWDTLNEDFEREVAEFGMSAPRLCSPTMCR